MCTGSFADIHDCRPGPGTEACQHTAFSASIIGASHLFIISYLAFGSLYFENDAAMSGGHSRNALQMGFILFYKLELCV